MYTSLKATQVPQQVERRVVVDTGVSTEPRLVYLGISDNKHPLGVSIHMTATETRELIDALIKNYNELRND